MARGEGPVDKILRGSPALRQGMVEHAGSWMLSTPGVLNIHAPLDLEDVQRIGANATVRLIQFAGKLDDAVATLQLLDEHVLTRHPRASVQTTLNGHGTFDDLAFLRHLPRLRALNVNGNYSLDLQPICRHVALDTLGVGGLGTSLRPLEGYPSLTSFAYRERVEGIETIGTLSNLERLSIGGASPRSLGFLTPLARLTSLAFQMVAPRRFEDLCALPALEELSIWRAAELEMQTLAPLDRIARLRQLVLQQLPHITSFDWLHNASLQVVELEDMKGLRSYASLAGLPDLRTLILKDTVTPAQLAELTALPRLEAVHVHRHYLAALGPAASKLRFAVVPI